MRWIKIALLIAVLLVLATAALLLAVHFTNLSAYKQTASSWLSTLAGRPVRIEGGLDINIGRNTTIEAHDMCLHGAAWSDEDNLLCTSRIKLRLDLAGFLDGFFVIEELELQDAELHIRQNAAGQYNWTEQTENADPAETEIDFDLPNIVVRHLNIQNLAADFMEPDREAPLTIQVDHLSQHHDQAGMLNLDGAGRVDEWPLQIQGRIGTWLALREGRNIHGELDVQVDAAKLHIAGDVENVEALTNLHLQIEGTDPHALVTSRLFGEALPGTVTLRGVVHHDTQGGQIEWVADVGSHHLEVIGNLPAMQPWRELSAQLVIAGPDLNNLFPELPVMSYRVEAQLSPDSAGVQVDEANITLGQLRVNANGRYDWIGSFNIDANGGGPRLADIGAPSGMPLTRTPFTFAAQFTGSASQFKVSHARLDAAGEGLHFSGDIIPSSSGIRVDNLRIKLADSTLDVAGNITHAAMNDPLRVTWQVPDLSALDMLYDDADALPAVAVSGHTLAFLDASTLVLHDTQLTIDGNTVQGDIRWQPAHGQRTPHLNAILQSRRLDLRRYFTAASESERALELPRLPTQLNLLDAHINFTSDNVQLTDDTDASLALTAEIDRDLLEFDLTAHLAAGRDRIELGGSIDVATGDANLQTDARFSNPGALLPSGTTYKSPPGLPMFIRGGLNVTNGDLNLDDLNLALGTATVDVSGKVTRELGDLLKVTANIPDLSELGELGDEPLPAISIAGQTSAHFDDATLVLDNLDLMVDQNHVQGTFSWQPAHERHKPFLKAHLRSDQLDLRPYLEADETTDMQPAQDIDRLIPDAPLQFDQLNRLNGQFDIASDSVQLTDSITAMMNVTAVLEQGALDLQFASQRHNQGHVSVHALLQPHGSDVLADVNAVGDGLKLAALSAPNQQLDTLPTYGFQTEFKASGETLRQLAGSLNGWLRFEVGRGTIQRLALTRVYGDFFTELVTTLNPWTTKSKQSRLSCAALLLEMKDGLATGSPGLVWRTDEVTLFSSGQIDLGTENVDLRFRVRPRSNFSLGAGEILNQMTKVSGTLAQPRLSVDTKGAALSGGLAVSTGGLSLLLRPAWDRLRRSKKPCQEAIAFFENRPSVKNARR